MRCEAVLAELATQPIVGVEIGVFLGDMSRRLLAADERLMLYMVDPWRQCLPGESYATTDDYIARFTQEQHDAAMVTAVAVTQEFGERRKIVRKMSVEAARGFPDAYADFVFIDGDHSYQGCKTDCEAWWAKVRKRGLLCGHDWREERGYGVIPAVTEFARAVGREIRLGANYTWFLTK